MQNLALLPSTLRPAPAPASGRSLLRFTDPNQFRNISEWDLDCRQIEGGAMEAIFAVRASKALTVMDVQFSKAVHQLGRSPVDKVTVGIQLSTTHLKTWHGMTVPRPSLFCFGHGVEFEGTNEPGSRTVVVSIPTSRIEHAAARLGLCVPETLLRTLPLPVFRNPYRLEKIAELSRNLICPTWAPPRHSEEDDIISELLLAATDAEQHDDRSTLRKRSKAVKTALDCMANIVDENTPISKICAETGVSWRTLDRAFHERFGIGPKAYHTRLRLSRARSDILERGRSCVISDVANKWGFWHMGQFARDYKDLFGELPSETRMAQSVVFIGANYAFGI
jgi:AraC family transcriptional regulator, ethanolamine operon transcriptional activator